MMDREMRLTVSGVAAGAFWILAVGFVTFDALTDSFKVGRLGLLFAAIAVAVTLRHSMSIQGTRTRTLMRALMREQELERGLHRVP
jgi:hypothetical protein